MQIALPTKDLDEPVSVWSDDESDTILTQQAMDDWVSEVNRFLGGSPRQSESPGGSKPGGRERGKSSPKEVGSPHTPRASPRTPKCSPNYGLLGGKTRMSNSHMGTPPSQVSSGPPTPTMFRPYTPRTPVSVGPTSRSSLPPRPPPPITLPPVRPIPNDVPEDILTSDQDDYFGPAPLSGLLTGPCYTPVHTHRAVRCLGPTKNGDPPPLFAQDLLRGPSGGG